MLKTAAAVTALFSLATLADQLHRYLELFSHFRLQYLLAAAVLAIALFILRSKRWAAVVLILTIINAIPVIPWYLSHGATAGSAEPRFKLLLSNVYAGNEDSRPLLDLITAEQADFVFLQEVTGRRAEELVQLGERYPYSLNVPREDNFGISVLSRHPFENARIVESPPFNHPTLVVEALISGKAVTLVTTHPVPPLGDTAYDARNIQLASIAELLNSIRGARILIGDLNTTMWAYSYEQLVESTGLVDVRQGSGILPSWPTHLPFAMIPIDHCLVSDELLLRDIRTGPDIGSDHLPLIVELSL
jgi:endonuclease/exonuclease/phosphatase (EEP) superfamily protein YafD